MTLSAKKQAQPMIGQVGGASIHKKPVLTLASEYVLKPVLTDHRGIREIAFYEAMEAVAKAASISPSYSSFLRYNPQKKGFAILNKFGEIVDTIAMACAMLVQDQVVVSTETAMRAAWRKVRKEAEALHTICKFTPSYYGIVGLEAPSLDYPHGISDETHLLLGDLTANYSKPCVLDLKMGTTTYEPDATTEKKDKEHNKYPQQGLFGFRIVGMRIYDPGHEEADKDGYRFFGKEYGRGLAERDQVKEALKIFFSAGAGKPPKKARNSINGRISPVNENAEIRGKSASNVFTQIRLIQKWFEENKSLLFCASSLLLVYEGNVSCEAPDITTVRMIDFGRVRRNRPAGDPGYVHGLSTFKRLVKEILEEEEKRLEELGASSNSRI